MTVTFFRLSGTRENFDKTIRDLLDDGWTSGNTNSITPVFESDTEEPDNMATSDDSAANAVRVGFIARERDSDQDPLGDTVHHWVQVLIIEIQAQYLADLTLFEDEVNRILWENAPNSGTSLPKSDTAASEALYFEPSEIEFVRIIEEEEGVDWTPQSEGELRVHYLKTKS